MTTMTAARTPVKTNSPARKPRTVKPVHGVVRLAMAIGDQTYTVKPLPVEPGSGVVRLVRLRKDDSTHYHVSRHEDGTVECDCPSFEFDHKQKNNGGCKHIAACSACGLL